MSDHGARSDADLLRAHVDGDPHAFGELFTRHRDRLWAVALRTLGDPEEAADALQDALVSAFRRAETFRGDAQVTTWLHRIVVNACLDRVRRAQVRAADPLPDDLDDRAARGSVLVSRGGGDPATVAEQHDLRDRLRAALATLPVDQRAALVLVDVEGLSVEEAARVLECPTGTVKSRCSRGRARLAALLGGTDPPPGASHPERSRPGDPPGPTTTPHDHAPQHDPAEEVT